MLKQIRDCSYVELHDFMVNNLRKIVAYETNFPYAILMFLNNPNVKYMSVKEKRQNLKKILSELNEETLNKVIELGDEDE